VIGAGAFLILCVIICLEVFKKSELMFEPFSYICMVFPNDPNDPNCIQCKVIYLVVCAIKQNFSDTLDFIVYHGLLLYLHYRKENVGLLAFCLQYKTHIPRLGLPPVIFCKKAAKYPVRTNSNGTDQRTQCGRF
jgi:hypothetical protein